MPKQPSFYAILTANVRYDRKLSFRQKVLFAEITALSNMQGYCNASNGWFGKLYDCSPETISRDITALRKRGYVKIYVDRVAGNKRKIYPRTSHLPIDETVNTPIDETIKPIDETVNTPIDETINIIIQDKNTTLSSESDRPNESKEATPTPGQELTIDQMEDYLKNLILNKSMYMDQVNQIGKQYDTKVLPVIREVLEEYLQKDQWVMFTVPINEDQEYRRINKILSRVRTFLNYRKRNNRNEPEATPQKYDLSFSIKSN